MSYQVSYRPVAKKDLAAIPTPYRAHIRERINALADEPRPLGVKKLAGMGNLHRIRVGMYRVVYEIVDSRLVVMIVAAADRDGIYQLVKRRMEHSFGNT
jgi:mRNA interferase RelE/StbE